MSARAFTLEIICRTANTTNVILEAFEDNTAKEAKYAGSIFCDTLNGRIISFPETMTQAYDIMTYTTKMMAQANLNEIATAINAKSYSVNSPRPDIVYPKGYLDMYEIETNKLIMPEEDVL